MHRPRASIRPRARRLRLAVGLLIPALVALEVHASSKADEILMQNGDHITGEIKGLAQGQLKLSTDNLGTILINWDHVAEIISKMQFQVELTDGTRQFGSLDKPSTPGEVVVQTDGGPVAFKMTRVVRIVPIKQTFWKRLSGSFSVGGSYTKSSEVVQLSLSGETTHRARKNIVRTSVNGVTTTQSTGTTQQVNADLTHQHLFRNRWFSIESLVYQRSQETGIQNRVLGAGGIGRWLVNTNRQTFSIAGGLDVNYEDTTTPEAPDTSLEGFVAFSYSAFRYQTPKQNVTIALTVFPGLTDWGRVRAQGNVNLRQEIVNDFFFDLSLYSTHDSDPPEGALSSNDYGVVTSLGYSFP